MASLLKDVGMADGDDDDGRGEPTAGVKRDDEGEVFVFGSLKGEDEDPICMLSGLFFLVGGAGGLLALSSFPAVAVEGWCMLCDLPLLFCEGGGTGAVIWANDGERLIKKSDGTRVYGETFSSRGSLHFSSVGGGPE